MGIAEELSQYAFSVKYSEIPENIVHDSKKRIIDALGCGIGAFNAEPVRFSRRIAQKAKLKDGSTLLGTGKKSTPDLASFVNGIMVRYFDYNDTYLSREPAHPSDNLGACLSVADSEGASGRDLLLSVALAFEIQCRLCDAADLRHRGWDHVCYGLVSTALASGRLMNLNPEKMTQAVNLSLNSHITMRQVRTGELSMWKGCSFANAGRNGVFSALLAREGMTGPSPIFEGEMGFFKQVSGPFQINTEDFGGRNGKFRIGETYLKYFPAEIHSQTAIWAALEARKEIEDLNEIVSVEIASHEAGHTILGKDPEKWAPATKETADHSLPYIVAMALLEGKIDNSSYAPKKFKDPKTLDFLKKVTVAEDKDLTAMYPEAVANRVTVKLSSGKVVSKQVNYHKGHPKNPMSDQDVEKKFRTLTKRQLSENQAKRALNILWTLEKVNDVSKLFSTLVVE
ncbi:MmgE/PrpD family protein [Candidatus Bathyarchaeota archaeon]|nr:MAG: MmgE/PrpD family protein [Candidatus Bathyarchaeota archaeon]TMI43295.1 MAG: MmgE/PrpD family protein [Candidatus Bathyarchaeota archaeon]